MFETEAERLAHIAARVATIERAIAFVEETGDGCKHILHQTSIRQHLQEDPAMLVAVLRGALVERGLVQFGAWKASQQICKAAGLPY